MPQAITEEMGVHQEWYAARPSLAELPEFIRHLTEDYTHDYGTICHAMAAAALATLHAIDESPQGGITGFQAGAIMWQFVVKWQHLEGKPLRLVEYENMLYPQYENAFTTITPACWTWLQEEAKKNLAKHKASEDGGVHPDVLRHWRSICAGTVPFGYRVASD